MSVAENHLFMSFLTQSALSAASALAITAALISCVNEDYDLTKDIDKTINIEGNICAPIGNSETILISDLLDIDENSMGVLAVGMNGDYSLFLSGNRTETTFSVPSVSITKNLVNEGGFVADINRSQIMGELGIVYPELPLPSGLTITRRFNRSSTPVVIDEAVPEEIIDVKDVTGKASGTISFRTNVGKATVSGLSLDFPDYLRIGKVTTGNSDVKFSFDKERNILNFDPVVVGKSPRSVSLEITGIDFDRMPAGQGFLGNKHRITVNDGIEISGFDVKMLSDDLGRTFSSIPEKIQVDVSIAIGSVDVSGATIKADPKINIKPLTVNVGTLPDFVNGDGTVLDLYDPQAMLFVGNGSPLALTLDADLESYKGDLKNTVHIGSKGAATEEIGIEAGKTNRIFLSRTGENAPDGYSNIKVPNLSDIVKNVPERIGIANVEVKVKDEFVTVQTGKDYSFYCSYDIIAPLAFGSGLRFDYSTDFTGWNDTFNPEDGGGKDFDINSADVAFDFVNMIPLGIRLTATAIDKNAKVIPGIAIEIDGNISAGSIGNPSRNPMSLNLKATADDMRRLDGVRLNLSASGTDSGHQGVCLNENQGVRLENMKIQIQGSVTTEL